MRLALYFFLLFLVCLFLAVTARGAWQTGMLGSCAVTSYCLCLAYAIRRPGVLLKRPDGGLGAFSYLLYWPYHLLNVLLLQAVRRWGRGNAFDTIDDGVYLGRRLVAAEEPILEVLDIHAVLDLTCEFAEPAGLRSRGAYLCIPLLDTMAPSSDELRRGAVWIGEQRAAGPVYIHCALGHGRSATFVAAWLLLSGRAASVEEALLRIRTARPGVGLAPAQMSRLRELEGGLNESAAWELSRDRLVLKGRG
jgi:protein-tyrosine phosphatase